jgi:hypothetical protein
MARTKQAMTEAERASLKAERAVRQAAHAETMRAMEASDRRMLASWRDDRFRSLIAAVEGGSHCGEEGWDHATSRNGLTDVFPLAMIADEAQRRGWPAPIIGAPRPGAGKGS